MSSVHNDLANLWRKRQEFDPAATDHPGLRLNNLTTTQRDALTGSGAPKAGDAIFNTTTNRIEVYNGTNWTGGIAKTAPVAAGGTLAMTEATHHGKVIALDTAAGSVVTLPASTGAGAIYRFVVTVTATSNSHIIKVANATDEMRGLLFGLSDDGTGGPVKGWAAADNDDTITFNRTTTGTAAQGHYVEIHDVLLNHFMVSGFFAQSGTEATPFSNTVS